VLNGDESRGFWVCWDAEGKIEVGRDGEEEAFMSYTEPEPFEITHYGVRTAWGANGDWEIHIFIVKREVSGDIKIHG
jgi:hypothetical protein